MRYPTTLFVLLSLSACGDKNGQDCSLYAAASVNLTLTDEAGDPIPSGATVRYQVDGGTEQDCEPMMDGSWVCGWEQVGHITVSVEAEGYEPITGEVDVGLTEDGCHAEGEVLELVLTESCDASVVVGAIVMVTDASGAPIPEPVVQWSLTYADMAPQDCVNIDGVEFHCATGQFGEISLQVTSVGFEPWAQDIIVPEGECGAETELVEVEMTPL